MEICRLYEKQDGEIILRNASTDAIRKAQRAFAGATVDIGVCNEEDVQVIVDEVRYGREA